MADCLPDAARPSGNKPNRPVGCLLRALSHAITATALLLTLTALTADCVGLPQPLHNVFEAIWCHAWVKLPAAAIDACFLVRHSGEFGMKAARELAKLWKMWAG